jgi:hypothetical protein
MKLTRLALVVVLVWALAIESPSSHAQCNPAWDPSFPAGAPPNGAVRALQVFDDGNGRQLYAAGDFTSVAGVSAAHIASWDGQIWRALGSGLNGTVHALLVHDDGTGRALYATGEFTVAGGVPATHIARWDGSSWSALAEGVSSGRALCVHDDGSGRALYVGGYNVRRWRAGAWSQVGNLGGLIQALESHDEGMGGGPRLWAGGVFPGWPTDGLLAVWDGSAWSTSPAGAPIAYNIFDNEVCVLLSIDSGSGLELLAGGNFTGAYNGGVWRLWNGAWSELGYFGYGGSVVKDLELHDDGSGSRLYATGAFDYADGPAHSIVQLVGSSWLPLAMGLDGYVQALASFDGGSSTALYAGVDTQNPLRIRRWASTSGIPTVTQTHDVGSALVGTNVSLTATVVAGQGPFTFQWHRNGASLSDGGPVSGAATDTLHLQLVSSAFSDGVYAARVSGPCGTGLGAPAVSITVVPGPGQPVCSGSTTPSACPCANGGVAGDTQGCRNSLGREGWLAALGVASVGQDTLVLSGQNMTNAAALFFQGNVSIGGGAGAVFGDGLLCPAQNVTRLATRVNVAGASVFPAASDPRLSTLGGLVGGETRTYQVLYRDAASYCTAAAFNLTNGVAVTWGL